MPHSPVPSHSRSQEPLDGAARREVGIQGIFPRRRATLPRQITVHEKTVSQIRACTSAQQEPTTDSEPPNARLHKRSRAFAHGLGVRIGESVIDPGADADEAPGNGRTIAERSHGQRRCDIIQIAFHIGVSARRQKPVDRAQIAPQIPLSRAPELLPRHPDTRRKSRKPGRHALASGHADTAHVLLPLVVMPIASANDDRQAGIVKNRDPIRGRADNADGAIPFACTGIANLHGLQIDHEVGMIAPGRLVRGIGAVNLPWIGV